MAHRAFLLHLLLNAASLHGAGATKCYFHDASVDNSPGINPAVNGTTNMCCDSGESFLPNGLCLNNTNQTITRRSCTDKNWDAAGCQSLCADHFDAQRSQPWIVTPCDGTPTSLTWCCRQRGDLNGECCQGGVAFARYTIAAKLGDPIPNQGVSTATSNRGLSTGAKAGIAVGVVAGVMISVGTILYSIRFRRWKKKVETSIGKDASVSGWHYPSPSSTSHGSLTDMKPSQLNAMENLVHEAPVVELQELDGKSLRSIGLETNSPTSPRSTTPLTRPSSVQQTPQMMVRTPRRIDSSV